MNERLARRHGAALEEMLGRPGRMISFSKSGYRERHPDHVTVFNANLCLRGGKIWYGDLDLTVDEPALAELARSIGTRLFVLSERDARFEHEEKPLLCQAICSVTPSGICCFESESIERGRDGSLRRRKPAQRRP
jgi:hypothetical protein